MEAFKRSLEEIALWHDVDQPLNDIPYRAYKLLINHLSSKLFRKAYQAVLKRRLLLILSVSEMEIVKDQMVKQLKDQFRELELVFVLKDLLLPLH